MCRGPQATASSTPSTDSRRTCCSVRRTTRRRAASTRLPAAGAPRSWTWCPQWCVDGNLEYDFGGADATENPVIGPQAGLIGNYTGVNGIVVANTNGFGAQLALHRSRLPGGGAVRRRQDPCLRELARVRRRLGCRSCGNVGRDGLDMTGGSSGGQWYAWFGKPGQIGGAIPGGVCCNYLTGHNDWAACRCRVHDERDECAVLQLSSARHVPRHQRHDSRRLRVVGGKLELREEAPAGAPSHVGIC